jgi:hypothetical protein
MVRSGIGLYIRLWNDKRFDSVLKPIASLISIFHKYVRFKRWKREPTDWKRHDMQSLPLREWTNIFEFLKASIQVNKVRLLHFRAICMDMFMVEVTRYRVSSVGMKSSYLKKHPARDLSWTILWTTRTGTTALHPGGVQGFTGPSNQFITSRVPTPWEIKNFNFRFVCISGTKKH